MNCNEYVLSDLGLNRSYTQTRQLYNDNIYYSDVKPPIATAIDRFTRIYRSESGQLCGSMERITLTSTLCTLRFSNISISRFCLRNCTPSSIRLRRNSVESTPSCLYSILCALSMTTTTTTTAVSLRRDKQQTTKTDRISTMAGREIVRFPYDSGFTRSSAACKTKSFASATTKTSKHFAAADGTT